MRGANAMRVRAAFDVRESGVRLKSIQLRL